MVVMTYPRLPDQSITVQEKAVAHYQRCGWVRADEEPEPARSEPEPAPEDAPQPDGGDEPTEDK